MIGRFLFNLFVCSLVSIVALIVLIQIVGIYNIIVNSNIGNLAVWIVVAIIVATLVLTAIGEGK